MRVLPGVFRRRACRLEGRYPFDPATTASAGVWSGVDRFAIVDDVTVTFSATCTGRR
jgi:hypothetical protein